MPVCEIRCPHCGHRFNEKLPDVSAEQAAKAKADPGHIGIGFTCPSCQQPIAVTLWEIRDKMDSP